MFIVQMVTENQRDGFQSIRTFYYKEKEAALKLLIDCAQFQSDLLKDSFAKVSSNT